jgi:uncharacterized protein
MFCLAGACQPAAAQQALLPELTQPVNDFAGVIEPASAQQLDRLSRALRAASGDVIVVATVPSFEPYAELREYAVKLFENRGRGIGDKGRDNGLLVVLALKERSIWIEVGYDLEQWITDGFAGETVRDAMLPEFRNGRYGPGLVAGATRIAARIARGRNVSLTGGEAPPDRGRGDTGLPLWAIILIVVIILMIRGSVGPPRRRIGRWGGRGWSGWSSGVGPFGGGFGGRSGGFGGGFGGFGGGRSGGGGAGGRW